MVLPDPYVEHLCGQLTSLQYLFMGAVFVLVLMLIWFPFVDPSSGTFVIVVLNLIGGGFLAVVSGLTIRRCRTELREIE